MKRGERRLWRELAELATKVAESKNYAEEYMAVNAFGRKLRSIPRHFVTDQYLDFLKRTTPLKEKTK